MTAIWGPLGWMTLHSVASLYPDEPTPSEKQLMSVWLDLFRDTITCHYCRGHFTDMYAMYRQKFPGMFNSRQELMAFVFRAHNTVNRRLNKPVYGTVAECMEVLRNNVRTRSATEYRVAYLNHIRRYWRSMQDVSGITSGKKVIQMTQIESDYFSPRSNNFDRDIEETLVILPLGVIEKASERTILPRRLVAPPAMPVLPRPEVRRPGPTGFRFTSEGLRLRL